MHHDEQMYMCAQTLERLRAPARLHSVQRLCVRGGGSRMSCVGGLGLDTESRAFQWIASHWDMPVRSDCVRRRHYAC